MKKTISNRQIFSLSRADKKLIKQSKNLEYNDVIERLGIDFEKNEYNDISLFTNLYFFIRDKEPLNQLIDNLIREMNNYRYRIK